MSRSIQETFRQADLKKGEKYTLLYTNDFAFPCASKITFESMEERSYAQYKDAVRLIFRPCKKRNLYQKYFYGERVRFVVLRGWHDIETARKVSGGMREFCSGDYSFMERAVEDYPEDIIINYHPEPEIVDVTEAVVVRMVNGRMKSETYSLKDLENIFEVTGRTKDLSEERKHRLVRRAELDNRPILKGLVGPIWDGGRLRYEDEACNRILSA